MKKFLVIASAILLLCLASASYIFVSMGNARFWEYAIRRFERADKLASPKPGVIVFLGSSSINFWHTLADDT